MARLAILDRDGVINADSDSFVRSVAEWQPLPGSIEAIARLHKAGFVVTVASNQSGVGRGLFTRETVYGMHRKMRRLVRAAGGEIAAIAFCPHHPDEGCRGRKPRTGLYTRLANETGLPLESALVVGDSLRDLEAGDRVGADLWLVRTGKGPRSLAQAAENPPAWWSRVRVAENLGAVVAAVTA
ncbi:MAG: D-glycero-beta-D-manno-heptose 1,7-bisphosphate 7-phosphatase [Pseudomonadota bacterium]